jgi:hypothetical protein
MKSIFIILLLSSAICFGDICAFTPTFRSINEEIRFSVIKEKYFITPTSNQLNMVHGDIQQSIKMAIEYGNNGRNRNQGGVIASANGISQSDNKRCLESAYRELMIKCRNNNKSSDYSIECIVYNDNCSLGYYF